MFTVTSRGMRVTLNAAAAAAALLLAGCSNNDSGDSSSSSSMSGMPGMSHSSSSSAMTSTGSMPGAEYNDADVTFLEMMYPHHAQAIDMAKLAPERSQNPKILALATRIEQAQAPEMEQITMLLASFGKPAPTATMDHSGGGMGMMTADQMQALTAASGTEFDRMFLTMMIEHHTGAIEMANTELTSGTNTDAKQLADAIVSAQQAEIAEMNTLLSEI